MELWHQNRILANKVSLPAPSEEIVSYRRTIPDTSSHNWKAMVKDILKNVNSTDYFNGHNHRVSWEEKSDNAPVRWSLDVSDDWNQMLQSVPGTVPISVVVTARPALVLGAAGVTKTAAKRARPTASKATPPNDKQVGLKLPTLSSTAYEAQRQASLEAAAEPRGKRKKVKLNKATWKVGADGGGALNDENMVTFRNELDVLIHAVAETFEEFGEADETDEAVDALDTFHKMAFPRWSSRLERMTFARAWLDEVLVAGAGRLLLNDGEIICCLCSPKQVVIVKCKKSLQFENLIKHLTTVTALRDHLLSPACLNQVSLVCSTPAKAGHSPPWPPSWWSA
jgi:hypothetical protein